MGNAWFVNEVLFVPTPDDESAALNTLDLRKTAVSDEKFRKVLTTTGMPSETDKIVLTDYKPNALTYQTNTTNNRVAVFSEIYYPEDWYIYCDDQELSLGRVNYLLRAAIIPAGEHTITMKFVPKSLRLDRWSYACLVIILLIVAGGLSWPVFRAKK